MKENYTPVEIKKTKYQDLVKPYIDEAIKTLKELVDINSVHDESTATSIHPFGDGVEKALSYVASLGKRLGFNVDRCDNYLTELSYGDGEKILDIYAHCDVVPVNRKNWSFDPFNMVEQDGNFYGRGTCDDKGPGLACLYACKALMDNKLLGGYRLRFLWGGNEERDSLCLKHYFEETKHEYPTIGFSPDADYPLIYGEKSIYAYQADYAISLPHVHSFNLGDALNVVLAEAECEIDIDDSLQINSLLKEYLSRYEGLSGTFDGKKLFFKGIPSHGSLPWEGVNAGLHLLNFLGILFGERRACDIFNHYNDGMGTIFNGNFKDEYFENTSYNVGRIVFDGKKVSIFVNLRFPAGLKADEVIDNVRVNTGAEVTKLGGSEGFVADPKSEFIQTLLKAYQEETGDYESKPLAIGGGTYARESKNSVAFGAAFPGRNYRMHGDDEYFPVSDFIDNIQIYAHALDKLSIYLRGKK